MTQIALAAAAPAVVEDMTLIADNPADMQQAQAKLILWCEAKMGVCNAEMLEAQGNAARSKVSAWAGEERRWKRVAGRARLRWQFYEKVHAALTAGYYIVPPFPGEAFAIRTRRIDPSSRRSYHVHGFRPSDHDQSEETLAIGKGVWRNPAPDYENRERLVPDGKGGTVTKQFSVATAWLPLEFPIALVKPQILDAAQRAMAGKFFDRLSILPRGRKPDPIIMGEINMPHRPGETVNFFVAWWLDTKAL